MTDFAPYATVVFLHRRAAAAANTGGRPELAAPAAAAEMPVSMFRALPGNFNRMWFFY
jgi:hypothetical protein